MLFKIPPFETVKEVNRYTKSSFKSPLARSLAAAVLPLLGLAAPTQRATSGQGTARSLSWAHGVRHEYFNLNYFIHIILKKTVCIT